MQKIALITGTGEGIGKAIAKLLLKENFKVFGYSRTNHIKSRNFTFIKIDLSSLEEVQKIIFPKIDSSSNIILINNAATIGEITTLDKKSEARIIYEYKLNIITPTILCKKFTQSYTALNKLIINISSGAANKAISSWSTYCATKSALNMLTQVIAKEKHKNLNVISINPGVVDTKMQNKIRSSDAKYFPLLDKFISYYNQNKLENTQNTANKIHYIIQNKAQFAGNIVSLRDINIK